MVKEDKLINVSERIIVGLATTVTPYYKAKGCPLLRNLNIKKGYLDDSDILYLDEDFSNSQQTKKIKMDDVLVVHTGSNLGQACLVPEKYNGSLTFTTLVISTKQNFLDPMYLMYYINSKYGINEINSLKSGGAESNLNTKEMVNFKIKYPEKIEEQKAVSKSLNNVDQLIDSLEKLIKKKNSIFESTKQSLLNGKNKHTEWTKVKVGDIGIFDGNGVDKKINKDERKVRLLNYMDVMHNNYISDNMSKHFVTASETKYNKCLVKAGDIFLTPSSETREDIGVSAVALEDSNDLVYSYHVVRFRPTIDMDMKFRAYIFQNKKFLNQASKYCEGSGKRYVCSNKKFASFELEIPFDINEQAEIGRILYDMELEIKMLESKLLKFKRIKNGMIDDLLTGKVRLRYE